METKKTNKISRSYFSEVVMKKAEDISNKKCFGLKYNGNKTNIKRTTNKKINISKPSLIFILIYIFLFYIFLTI